MLFGNKVDVVIWLQTLISKWEWRVQTTLICHKKKKKKTNLSWFLLLKWHFFLYKIQTSFDFEMFFSLIGNTFVHSFNSNSFGDLIYWFQNIFRNFSWLEYKKRFLSLNIAKIESHFNILSVLCGVIACLLLFRCFNIASLICCRESMWCGAALNSFSVEFLNVGQSDNSKFKAAE